LGTRSPKGDGFFIDSESQLRAAAQGYADAGTSQSATAAPTEKLSIDLAVSPEPLKPARHARRDRQERRRAADWRRNRDGRVRDGGDALDEHASDASLGDAHPNRRRLRGSIDVPTAGRWDVTVSVIRGAERLGSRQLTVIVR
jgi:hypothetical protein